MRPDPAGWHSNLRISVWPKSVKQMARSPRRTPQITGRISVTVLSVFICEHYKPCGLARPRGSTRCDDFSRRKRRASDTDSACRTNRGGATPRCLPLRLSRVHCIAPNGAMTESSRSDGGCREKRAVPDYPPKWGVRRDVGQMPGQARSNSTQICQVNLFFQCRGGKGRRIGHFSEPRQSWWQTFPITTTVPVNPARRERLCFPRPLPPGPPNSNRDEP